MGGGGTTIRVLKIHLCISICRICVYRCGVHYFVENPTFKVYHTYIHIYDIYLYTYESLELQWIEPQRRCSYYILLFDTLWKKKRCCVVVHKIQCWCVSPLAWIMLIQIQSFFSSLILSADFSVCSFIVACWYETLAVQFFQKYVTTIFLECYENKGKVYIFIRQ